MNYSTIKKICELINVLPTELQIEHNYEHSYTITNGNEKYEVDLYDNAIERAKEYITENLWAFNINFIGAHSKLNSAALEALDKSRQEICEDANDLVKAVITDLDYFCEDAIRCDGLGHFLSSYDGNYEELNSEIVLWRTN